MDNGVVKPCDQCRKKSSILTPVVGNCPISLRNWSDCRSADASGVIYVNGVIVYSFDSTFDANVFIGSLPTNDEDWIKIILTPESCTFLIFIFEQK